MLFSLTNLSHVRNYLKEFFCKKCPFTIRMTCRDGMVKNETYKTLTDLYSKNISLKVMKSVKLISISKISPPIWSWRLLQVDQKESQLYFKSLWDERVLFMFSLANGKKQHGCISFFRSMSACVFLLKWIFLPVNEDCCGCALKSFSVWWLTLKTLKILPWRNLIFFF